ncbi:orotate phosphoribosyltransferase [Prolixibacter sp. SD074]|jgi:orotate phosphoribosyltransferase|uniref:orotate phosphoribosyltransferase n=1 Tax=Prolixibacter sp. SD074 TaxID=2652391 RepID=UPI00126E5589|nr:orotate phosphoribosyltransferase [Prolixibacter sp. SD074]GET30991.1 orotate phosphoribosyltransferase [Prolixibacter sp. SD074]
MEALQIEVAKRLLAINTIKISPKTPFTWASGWKSPIYCDNRKILSYPETRKFIYEQFAKLIKEKYPESEVIAGVATGAIAHGALVAEELGLPFVYVRSKPKDHGLENLIEGDLQPGKKVVVIEDLVSTGLSSLNAVTTLRNYGADVMGMLSIFSYNFSVAAEKFKEADVELTSLSNYNLLLKVAHQSGEITDSQLENLNRWRQDPAHWGR